MGERTEEVEERTERVGKVTERMTEEERKAKIKKYFKYSYSGLITNINSEITMNLAGSDYDGDIAFTTNNPQILKGIYKNETVTAYDIPKPDKKANLTDEDLFISDCFSFGQQIGQLTNISTAMYSLLPLFDENSEEYKMLIKRIKQTCVNQSKQIDKTKIGRDVKCIVPIWTQWQRIDEKNDSEEIKNKKRFNNRILADKKPYFFKYKYKTLNKEIRDFNEKIEKDAKLRFSQSLDELIKKGYDNRTMEENELISYYEKKLPVINSDCVMNKVCKHIEDVDFHIKQKVKSSSDFDYKTLLSNNFILKKEIYDKIKNIIHDTFKEWEEKAKAKKLSKVAQSFNGNSEPISNKTVKDAELGELKYKLDEVVPNSEQLANYLVYLFYVDKPSYNKSTLWNLVGKQLYNNIKSKHTSFNFPTKDENGALEFLYNKYQVINLPIPENIEGELNEIGINMDNTGGINGMGDIYDI